ncbi:MAG: DUF4184 family protein [Actinomycetota bacterium]|nr:DUF4184 family protein [Actinomycetota bacterium]
MPVTFPAHQGLVAALKLRWPTWIDGTALCIGAAAPDLAYALGSWFDRHSHDAVGLVVWALPFTIVATVVVRWRAAAGIFAHLPDLGPLRLRSYRVISTRPPRPGPLLVGATLGAASHVLIDGFTHTERWGSRWLGLDGVLATLPVAGGVTGAKVLQYTGHVAGSLLFVALVAAIAAGGRLEAWYGADTVARVRRHHPPRRERVAFWAMVAVPPVIATPLAVALDHSEVAVPVFVPISAGTVALIAAGALVPSAVLAPDGES